MATETEIKFKVEAHDALRERLSAIGAVRRGLRFEVNAFFDDHGKLKAQGSGLRLRSMRDEAGETRSVITYKGPATGDAVRSREEIEFPIGDLDAAAALLARLGYAPTIAFEKRRETWELEGSLIELDELPHLGRFVEIEGEDVTIISSIRARLGLAQLEPATSGYASMFSALIRARPELGPLVQSKDEPRRSRRGFGRSSVGARSP
jgi:adenylate cyclase class 2